jgi:putative flippase GtrA
MIQKKVLYNNLKRFILIGIISNIINFSVYSIIVIFFDSTITGSISGYLIGLFFSFYFGRTWVFGKYFKSGYLIVTKFVLVYLFGLLLMSSSIELMTKYFLIDYRISWLVAASLVFCTNFIGSKWIVFK